MRMGDIDKLAIANYIISGIIIIGSLVSLVIIILFKNLFPTFLHYQHKGLGTIQWVLLGILSAIIYGMIVFIEYTKQCEDAHGL